MNLIKTSNDVALFKGSDLNLYIKLKNGELEPLLKQSLNDLKAVCEKTYQEITEFLRQTYPVYYESLYGIKLIPTKKTSLVKFVNVNFPNSYKESKAYNYQDHPGLTVEGIVKVICMQEGKIYYFDVDENDYYEFKEKHPELPFLCNEKFHDLIYISKDCTNVLKETNSSNYN